MSTCSCGAAIDAIVADMTREPLHPIGVTAHWPRGLTNGSRTPGPKLQNRVRRLKGEVADGPGLWSRGR